MLLVSDTFSLGNSSRCQVCPAGFSCFDPTTLPIACLPGTFAAAGAVDCTPCPAGFYCPYNTTQFMLQCPAGTFANDTGNKHCKPCPEGHECQAASQQPRLCRRGTFSFGGASFCTSCQDGYFANYTGAVECEICPAGYSCQIAKNRPIVCIAGTYRYVLRISHNLATIHAMGLFMKPCSVPNHTLVVIGKSECDQNCTLDKNLL